MPQLRTDIVKQLKQICPDINIQQSDQFYWSPREQIVYYSSLENEVDHWSLLHEIGHAKHNHRQFKTDFDLLMIEIEAWQEAQRIASNLSIEIDEDHIQDCLDTYRDWLYLRSTCPICTSTSLQLDSKTYSCINCRQSWNVSKSRQKRCYRRKI